MQQIPKAPFIVAFILAIPFALLSLLGGGLAAGIGVAGKTESTYALLLNGLVVWTTYLVVYFLTERLFHLRRYSFVIIVSAFPIAAIISIFIITIL